MERDCDAEVLRLKDKKWETDTRSRMARLVVSATFAVFIIAFGVIRMDLAGLPGGFSDITLDKLVVNAVVDGEDPYLPIQDLADRYEVGIADLGDARPVHPRPPGSIVLLLPLALVPYDLVHSFSLIFNCLAALAFLFIVAVATNNKAEWILLAAPLLILSHPVISTFRFGSQSLVVAGLVTLAVWLFSRGDSLLAGVALGVAITLKLWPALVLVPLWRAGRRRGTLLALATSGGLTLLGAVAFGLSPLQIWQGLAGAGSLWVGFPANGSLAGRFAVLGASVPAATILAAAVLLPILILLWNRRISLDEALWGTVVVALFASPLSWDHYNIVLIPFALILARQSRGWFYPERWLLLGWAVLNLGGRFLRLAIDRPIELAGALAFSERTLILVALLVIVGFRRSPGAAVAGSSRWSGDAGILDSAPDGR